jgi:pimeloyl-ACP methyl ester carboxylesterase
VRHNVDGLVGEAHGPVDGPPVLLIAGGGADRTSWRRLVPEVCTTAEDRVAWKPVDPPLSARFRVAVFDQAGIGQSAGRPPRRTAVDLAADALAVGRSLLGDRFTVLGQSLGGCAAIHLALAHPETVTALVLVGTFGGAAAFVPAGEGPAGVPEARSFSAEFPTREADLFRLIVAEETARHADAEAAQVDVFLSHEATARLGELTMPTEIVCGDEDHTFALPNSELLARSVPGARLRVVAAGHGVHLEAPEALVEAVVGVTA